MMRILAAAASMLMLTTCGSFGTLSLRLTDAPPNTDEMQSVIVTLSKVDAHLVEMDDPATEGDPADTTIDTDSKWHSVPLTTNQFDLLRLQNGTTASLGDIELPPGKITQIRLFIDKAAANQIVLKDGRTCKLDLSNVPTTGIKINHVFKAFPVQNEMVTKVVLDFHLESSVDQTGDCAYRLNPVIKLQQDKTEVVPAE